MADIHRKIHCCSVCKVPIRIHEGKYGPNFCEVEKQDASKKLLVNEDEAIHIVKATEQCKFDIPVVYDCPEESEPTKPEGAESVPSVLDTVQSMMNAFQAQLIQISSEMKSLKQDRRSPAPSPAPSPASLVPSHPVEDGPAQTAAAAVVSTPRPPAEAASVTHPNQEPRTVASTPNGHSNTDTSADTNGLNQGLTQDAQGLNQGLTHGLTNGIPRGGVPPMSARSSMPESAVPSDLHAYTIREATAGVPQSQLERARQGNFVNLSDFLYNLTAFNVTDEFVSEFCDGKISFKPKSSKTKSIDNFDRWLQAWTRYETIIVAADPSLFIPVMRYRSFIHDCSMRYLWSAVWAYDVRFRSLRSPACFGNIDAELISQIFNVHSIKFNANTCARCKATDHYVKDCPFPSGPSEKKAGATQKSNQKSKGKQVCFKWNAGDCDKGSECFRLHVCRGCRGTYPFVRCNSCKSTQKPGQSSNNQ